MRLHVNKRCRNTSERGFTLIEVLIAIAILTLGAGGVAAMQLHALRTARHSSYQTSATQLAVELADIMRANPEAAHSSVNPYLFSYQADAQVTATSSLSPCVLHTCDAAAMAHADVAGWQQRLQQSIPLASAVVCRDSHPAMTHGLRWDCDHAGHAAIIIKIGWPDSPALASGPAIAIAVEI
ncbi:MAG TPA: type IV pilus modification protein PilV [Herbaspirillum sp.]|nr:type IV pilus modification protein PilV [Herbaspirillum sp.]